MSSYNSEDLCHALISIAKELNGIDVTECTTSERNIADVLVEHGFLKMIDRGEEVEGWQEYAMPGL